MIHKDHNHFFLYNHEQNLNFIKFSIEHLNRKIYSNINLEDVELANFLIYVKKLDWNFKFHWVLTCNHPEKNHSNSVSSFQRPCFVFPGLCRFCHGLQKYFPEAPPSAEDPAPPTHAPLAVNGLCGIRSHSEQTVSTGGRVICLLEKGNQISR